MLLFALLACAFGLKTTVDGDDDLLDNVNTEDSLADDNPVFDNDNSSSSDPLNTDNDGDGYSENEGDCNDQDMTLTPEDNDGDGYSTCDGDCNDNTSTLSPADDDNDDWSTCDGDCDDQNPYASPGQTTDTCDEIDNDCDGVIDENAVGDALEPNDTSPVDIGEFDAYGNYEIEARINREDRDRFLFYIQDAWWDDFGIDLFLQTNATNHDFVLELWLIEDDNGQFVGMLDDSDMQTFGGQERIYFDGYAGVDDSGWYEAVVYKKTDGGCDADYQLSINFGL